jgi:ferredoxin
MRVNVNRERCTGHALCVAVGGNLFDIDDEGLVTLLVDEAVPPQWHREARDGAQACPEQAITIEA